MLAKNMHHLIILIILGVTLISSDTSLPLQEPELIGRLPEITVTVPRYDIRGEMYPGMLEEVIVTAQRPSINRHTVGSSISYFSKTMFMVTLVTLLLVTLSIMYVSFRAFILKQEVDCAKTKYRFKKT
jgi:hypothetical protein